MIVVSDTSVITSLIHVGRERLLQQLHGTVLIPGAVRRELSRTHSRIPGFHVADAVLKEAFRLAGE